MTTYRSGSTKYEDTAAHDTIVKALCHGPTKAVVAARLSLVKLAGPMNWNSNP